MRSPEYCSWEGVALGLEKVPFAWSRASLVLLLCCWVGLLCHPLVLDSGLCRLHYEIPELHSSLNPFASCPTSLGWMCILVIPEWMLFVPTPMHQCVCAVFYWYVQMLLCRDGQCGVAGQRPSREMASQCHWITLQNGELDGPIAWVNIRHFLIFPSQNVEQVGSWLHC